MCFQLKMGYGARPFGLAPVVGLYRNTHPQPAAPVGGGNNLSKCWRMQIGAERSFKMSGNNHVYIHRRAGIYGSELGYLNMLSVMIPQRRTGKK